MKKSNTEDKLQGSKKMSASSKSFLKWAFSPIGTQHTYRGVGIKNPYPNILLPIVLPMMVIAALPILILYAPFWIFFKITEKKH